nr:PREDICTED: RNA-directed DNA polymerase from mobile element jockey-like [Megachile rotundata]
MLKEKNLEEKFHDIIRTRKYREKRMVRPDPKEDWNAVTTPPFELEIDQRTKDRLRRRAGKERAELRKRKEEEEIEEVIRREGWKRIRERKQKTREERSAPGEDGSGYDVMKLWTRGWKEAILIIYNEPQKRALRPISLMNCLGKTLERMVNERMRVWAEEENRMNINQNGFRTWRSTMDNISILVNGIRENWGKGRKVMAAFIDVKSAYDNVKHDGMIRGLKEMGCPTKMSRYIESWLNERKIEIRMVDGNAVRMKLQKGLPQGSVLSLLLYNLYTVGIVERLREMGVGILQYADDIVVLVEFEDRREGKSKIEEAISRLKGNLGKIGLAIAAEKTQIVKFDNNKRRGRLIKEEFNVEGEKIEEVDSAKFLGIDRALEFGKHTDYVVTKLKRRMNVLTV